MIDPYTDPKTGILRNKLGITDAGELAAAEADITGARLTRIAERPIPGNYDLAHLQEFHREIFGSIYPWAGQIRSIEIGKDTGFCLVRMIPDFADDVFRRLGRRDDQLRCLDREIFLTKAADLYGDVNALHPFREGNGRAQRAFIGQLADSAGHPISWSQMDPERNRLASIASYLGQNGPLRAMLADITTSPAAPEPSTQVAPRSAVAPSLVEPPPSVRTSPKPPTHRL